MVYSKFSDVVIPNTPLHECVFEDFERYGDKTAVVCGETGRSYTFRQVLQFTKNIAAGLAQRGYKKGDVIAVLLPNIPEFPLLLFGCLRAGLIVSTINPAYTKTEISRQLVDCGATLLCTVEPLLKTARQAVKVEPCNIKNLLVIGEAQDNVMSFRELMSADGSRAPEVTFDTHDDVAFIPYSSGTTGMPKGVLLTHRNVVANVAQTSHPGLDDPTLSKTDSRHQEVLMAFVPFFHSYGLCVLLCIMWKRGYKLVTMMRFEPTLFLETVQKYKVSILPLVPPIVVFLAKSPLVAKYDLSAIKRVVCGAAPLSRDTEIEFKRRLRITSIQQGYGLTETSPSVTAPMYTEEALARPGHSGVLLPNSEVRIVDIDTGRLCVAHERGELWVRGPNVMKGYLNRPDATVEMLDEQRWLHTGDVAYFDDEGFFFIVDRIKELIKYKGFQVAPAELEALLLMHPGVEDAGVIGIPDEVAGELPAAFIVRKPGPKGVEADDIAKFVAERVATFKHLRGGIRFLQIIPKSPSGKILRREMRDMVVAAGKKSKL